MVIYTVFENYKKMYPILTCSNCAEIDRLEINTYFVVSLYISPQYCIVFSTYKPFLGDDSYKGLALVTVVDEC